MQTLDLGYSITETCLNNEQCSRIAESLCAGGVLRSRAGARHLMTHPEVAAAANCDRLLGLAAEWLNGSAVPFRATLFEKSESSNWLVPWHQDTALPMVSHFEKPGWGPWSEKAGVLYAHAPAWALERVVALRLHLDDSGAYNGPLRVVPASHVHGVLTDGEVRDYASRHDTVACLTRCGGVLAMRPLLIHASSKAQNQEPRRVLHIEYACSLELEDGIRLRLA